MNENSNFSKEELEEIVRKARNKADLMHRDNLKKRIELHLRFNKINNSRISPLKQQFYLQASISDMRQNIINASRALEHYKRKYQKLCRIQNHNQKKKLHQQTKDKNQKLSQLNLLNKEISSLEIEITNLQNKKEQLTNRTNDIKQILEQTIPEFQKQVEQNQNLSLEIKQIQLQLQDEISDIKQTETTPSIVVDNSKMSSDGQQQSELSLSDCEMNEEEIETTKMALSTDNTQYNSLLEQTATFDTQLLNETPQNDWEYHQKEDIESYNAKMDIIKDCTQTLNQIDELRFLIDEQEEENMHLKLKLDEVYDQKLKIMRGNRAIINGMNELQDEMIYANSIKEQLQQLLEEIQSQKVLLSPPKLNSLIDEVNVIDDSFEDELSPIKKQIQPKFYSTETTTVQTNEIRKKHFYSTRNDQNSQDSSNDSRTFDENQISSTSGSTQDSELFSNSIV